MTDILVRLSGDTFSVQKNCVLSPLSLKYIRESPLLSMMTWKTLSEILDYSSVAQEGDIVVEFLKSSLASDSDKGIHITGVRFYEVCKADKLNESAWQKHLENLCPSYIEGENREKILDMLGAYEYESMQNDLSWGIELRYRNRGSFKENMSEMLRLNRNPFPSQLGRQSIAIDSWQQLIKKVHKCDASIAQELSIRDISPAMLDVVIESLS